jgi:hypothetical protein
MASDGLQVTIKQAWEYAAAHRVKNLQAWAPAVAGDGFLYGLNRASHIPLPHPWNQRTCRSATWDTQGVTGVSQIETG